MTRPILRPLTELEQCVLGVIWRRRPCSAYDVRIQFERSLSRDWSSSAGSIYPTIRRLRDLDLVAEASASGPRKRKLLELTDTGFHRLREWIAGIDAAATSPTYDPVRTRFTFIDALDPRDRVPTILGAIAGTGASLDRVLGYCDALGDDGAGVEALAARGAIYELRARLAWLEELLAAPGDAPIGDDAAARSLIPSG